MEQALFIIGHPINHYPMKQIILLPGLLLLVAILFTGCITERPADLPLSTPIDTTLPVTPVTTPVTPSGIVAGVPLITPDLVDISIQASPEKYNPLMSSTVGIGLTPLYAGSAAVVYNWTASYGHFISWNAQDWKVIQHGDSVETINQTIYWSYSPDDMGKEKPPVTIRVIIKRPPRVHGGGGTIAWKDIHIHWENTDTAVIEPN